MIPPGTWASFQIPVVLNPWLQTLTLIGAVVGLSWTFFFFITRKKRQDALGKKIDELSEKVDSVKNDFTKSDFLFRTEIQSIGGRLATNRKDIDANEKAQERIEQKVDNVAKEVSAIDKKVEGVATDVKHILKEQDKK